MAGRGEVYNKKSAVSCQCSRAQGRNCHEMTSTVAVLVQGHRSQEAVPGPVITSIFPSATSMGSSWN